MALCQPAAAGAALAAVAPGLLTAGETRPGGETLGNFPEFP